MPTKSRPQVVIIGAGFGGLHAARVLADKSADVLLIDRNNFHTFTPLLYQVATCGLDPSEIAYPVRTIFRKNSNVRFLLGEVLNIDTHAKQVSVKTNSKVHQAVYDYLVLAAGSVTSFFGGEQINRHAFGLKNLSEAVVLRNHILKLFEKAAWIDDPQQREALTTMVVVGGGPTGLETAGALYELYNYVVKQEYAKANNLRARVILLEATDHLLAPYPKRLQLAALKQLESLGVEVIFGGVVDSVEHDHVTLRDGRIIATHTLIWSAGVKGSPLGDLLGVTLRHGGRIPVNPDLSVTGLNDVYAVGDIAYLEDGIGEPYPQMIPVANQQGTLAGKNILRRMNGQPEMPFHYVDKGLMATIGRSRAVAWVFNRVQLSGYPAWVAWLFLHLVTLMGFRNRISVFISWVWNYLTYDRSVRIILEHHPHEGDALPEPNTEVREPERGNV